MNDNNFNDHDVGTRVAHLPAMAANVFQRGKDGQRTRTVLMKVGLHPEDLEPFGLLAVTSEETADRLEYLTEQYTGAIQHMLKKLKKDLFDDRRDILLSVAAERDYDAKNADEKGWLEVTDEVFELGTKERPLSAQVWRHYKIGKEMVAPGTQQAKAIHCARIGEGLFLKLEVKKVDKGFKKSKNKDEEMPQEQETLSIKSFYARSFGGFLSAAYWTDAKKFQKPQKKSYTFGRLGEEYARTNSDRTRREWLKDEHFSANVGEAVRQKVAENVCSFLEKYYSVQPTVRHFNASVGNALARTLRFLEDRESDFGEAAKERLVDWREVAGGFKMADGRDPADVERLAGWVAEYNMRTNKLRQVLPEEWFEEGGEADKVTAMQTLKEMKGYPSWPEYKPDDLKLFDEKLGEIRAKIGTFVLSGEQIVGWVKRTWLDGELHHLDYLAGRLVHGPKKEMPLRKKLGREIFARTGGKLIKDESGGKVRWSYSWEPSDGRINEVTNAVIARLWRDFEAIPEHTRRVLNDFAALRRQVDVLVSLANLYAETVAETGRGKYLAEINHLAGDAKGALLSLAEGTKEEVQLSGFSASTDKRGGAWSLNKNACLAVAGNPGGKERLALLFDPSNNKKSDSVKIVANADAGELRLVAYLGGAGKKDSTDEQKTRRLVTGGGVGSLGKHGVILPLQFGLSQARRFFYPRNGHPEDGVIGAMAAGKVDIGNARIIRKVGRGGKPDYFVALSVKLPRPELDSRSVAPGGYIGVDRGETHLAVMAETDLDGRLVAEPQLFGNAVMSRVGRAYQRLRRNQSQMKRLEGGNWFEARITNAVRIIAVKAVEMMLKDRRAVVFEDLSRGFARGGTASWEHQYTKVEDHLKDVLSFCGLNTKEIYHYTDKNKDKGHVWFGKVGAAFTSQTCPSCGTIWGKPGSLDRQDGVAVVRWDERRAPRPDIQEVRLRDSDGCWVLAWPDKAVAVPDSIARQCAVYVGSSNKSSVEAKRAGREILGWLNHRSRLDYEHFRCRYCGVMLHADKVGALNIARKAIFQKTHKVESRKRDDWQRWYMDSLNDSGLGWWNRKTEDWLK